MKQTLISVLKLLGLYSNPVVPESVKKNFLSLSEANAAILKTAVIDIFFFGKEADITRPENVEDYDAHSYGRLKNFRAATYKMVIAKYAYRKTKVDWVCLKYKQSHLF